MSLIHKAILSLVSSMFALFLVWLIIGYANYGDDIVHKHLDLYQTINKFTILEFGDRDLGQIFFDTFKSFRQSLITLNNSSIARQFIKCSF